MEKIILFSVFGVLFFLEILAPYFETFRNRARHTFRNVMLIVLNAGIAALIISPIVVWSLSQSWGVFTFVTLDWKVELLLTILLIDRLTYVMQWLCVLYIAFPIKFEFLLIYETVFFANVLFHHANLSIGEPLDRIYRIFFTSPNMHKVHHSDIREEMDTNYTSLLSVWARIFGTFCIVDNPKRIVFGLRGMAEEQTVGRMFTTPFRYIDTE